MFKVFYKYSACIKIKTESVSILCDPWFGDNAYYGTWTQYPKIKDKFELIGYYDYIYISHIHPDHYCEQTIKELFQKYPNKKIIITNWGDDANYLKRKLISDGFGEYIVCNESNKYQYSDTIVNLYPNRTGSESDIDSYLIVNNAKSFNYKKCLDLMIIIIVIII